MYNRRELTVELYERVCFHVLRPLSEEFYFLIIFLPFCAGIFRLVYVLVNESESTCMLEHKICGVFCIKPKALAFCEKNRLCYAFLLTNKRDL